MKGSICCIIISAIICLPSYSLSNDYDRFSWGYLLHSSRLRTGYLDALLPQLKVLSITGYRIQSTGEIAIESTELMKSAIATAGRHNVAVYPLISFRSSSVGHAILNSPKLQEKVVAAVRKLVSANVFRGIHLDFEYLPPGDAPKLGEFIKKIRSSLPGVAVTMAIFPQVDFPEQWRDFHNLQILSPLLDRIVLMCYDYHRPGTAPGPVTDIDWAEKNIREVLKFFTPGKVWLGIPAYGYRWQPDGKAVALSSRHGIKLARKYGSTRHRSGTVHITYRGAGGTSHIYFSDSTTRKSLQALADRFGLAGTALWRLGFED